MSTVVTRSKPRLIHGIILKCVDGHWRDGDDITPTGEIVVVHTTRALQCWKDKELLDYEIEQPGETLTRGHAAELNAPIPKEEWGLGLDGQPRPPWAVNWVVYLIDLTAGQRYTYLNSTWGAQIGVEKLEDRMIVQRALRGPGVRPIVKLDSAPMKTKQGQKMRPEFTVLEWRDFSGGGGALLQVPGQFQLQIEHQNPAPTEKPKTKVGKPVKPVSVSEELNDDLPDDLAPPKNILKAG
jgi:hypothetical protein